MHIICDRLSHMTHSGLWTRHYNLRFSLDTIASGTTGHNTRKPKKKSPEDARSPPVAGRETNYGQSYGREKEARRTGLLSTRGMSTSTCPQFFKIKKKKKNKENVFCLDGEAVDSVFELWTGGREYALKRRNPRRTGLFFTSIALATCGHGGLRAHTRCIFLTSYRHHLVLTCCLWYNPQQFLRHSCVWSHDQAEVCR